MLISIITPCFNCSDYIFETYQSVKKQTYQNWEWLCVDDQSTDNTYKLLKELSQKDSRVKVFQNKTNSGAAVTRNVALDNAQGVYLAFLDSDDLWRPDKLQKQLEFMQKNNVAFSYHDYELVDNEQKVLSVQKPAVKIFARDILKFNPFATSSVIIKRHNVTNIRFRDHLRRRQDYVYWYECLKACGKAHGLKEILSLYRVNNKLSLSANKIRMASIQWNILKLEFNLPLHTRVYYFLRYALHGIRKYFL